MRDIPFASEHAPACCCILLEMLRKDHAKFSGAIDRSNLSSDDIFQLVASEQSRISQFDPSIIALATKSEGNGNLRLANFVGSRYIDEENKI
jgi:hypothetical protein